MNKKVLEALNAQINLELESAYIYLNMSIAMEDQNLSGFANWLFIQWHEEIEHAEKLIDFAQRRGEKVTLETIEVGEVKGLKPLEVAEQVLAHEQLVSSKIHELRKLALAEDDVALALFLDWFVEEQVEEEENAQALVDQFSFAGDDKAALLIIDARLGKRPEED